ncbi:DUF3592 domain-containing protein [Desulfobacula sp.]
MKTAGEKNNIFSIFFKIMMLCICAWFLVMSFSDFLFGSFSMTWPKTQGIVLEKSLTQEPAGSGTLWKPVIKYSYRVEDKEYAGEKISFFIFVFSKKWATDSINKYDLNSKVDVFYNPFNHKISCLKPGPELAAAVYSIIGMGGIFYLIYSFYQNRKKT